MQCKISFVKRRKQVAKETIYLFIFSKQNEVSQMQNYNNPSLNVKKVSYTKSQFELNIIILIKDWSNRELTMWT